MIFFAAMLCVVFLMMALSPYLQDWLDQQASYVSRSVVDNDTPKAA